MQIKDVFSTSHWMKRQQIFLIDYGLNVQKYLGPSIILLFFFWYNKTWKRLRVTNLNKVNGCGYETD